MRDSSDLLAHELQKRLLVRLLRTLGVGVAREVALNKVDRFGHNFVMASATVLDSLGNFADSFKRKHVLAFFEHSQADVRRFCLDFCQVADDHASCFQTRNGIQVHTRSTHLRSSLTSKHTVIRKRPSSQLTPKSTSRRPKVNAEDKSCERLCDKFQTFRSRFLEYVADQVGSAYNVDFLKSLFDRLIAKSCSSQGESVLGNFTSKWGFAA